MSHSTALFRATPLAVHHLGQRFLLAEWQGPALASVGRLRVSVGGQRVRPPFSQISLPLQGLECRNFLAVSAAPSSATAPMELREADGRLIARFEGEPRAISPAHDFDAHALVLGLDGAKKARLVRFILEVCGPLFRVCADPVFVCNCRTLLSELAAGSGSLLARCTLTADYMFCEGVVPDSLGERLSAILLSDEGIIRMPAAPTLLPPAPSHAGREGLGLVVPYVARKRGSTVVVFGENGLVCRTVSVSRRRMPSAHDWFLKAGKTRPQHRRYILETLARGQCGAAAASMAGELRVLAADADRQAEAPLLHASTETVIDCGEGLFVTGRLIDPHRLAVGIDVDRLGVTRSVRVEKLARFQSPREMQPAPAEVARSGFAAFIAEPDDAAGRAPVRLSLSLRSGSCLELGEGPALLTPEQACEALLATVPQQGADAALLACIEPALRALLRRRSAQTPAVELKEIGCVPSRPLVSVLMPFARDTEVLRCRLGIFAEDADIRQAECIYLVEREEDWAAAEAILGDLHDGYGVGARLLLSGHGASAGAVIAAASTGARGDYIAFLGRSAVPENGGWLGKLTGFLKARPQRGIVGAQALHPDHSLVSAGAAIALDAQGSWRLRPLLAGFPRDYAPASVASRVNALAPDCFVLSRALLHELRGYTGDYLTEASAVAELCLQAAARGRECWRLPEPAVFRLGADGGPADDAQSAAREELDRRLLERRWRDLLQAESTCLPPREVTQAASPTPAAASGDATRKAA